MSRRNETHPYRISMGMCPASVFGLFIRLFFGYLRAPKRGR